MAANLIDPDTGLWKTTFIQDHFQPDCAQEILSLPIHPSSSSCLPYWSKTRNGKFSVISEYLIDQLEHFNCRGTMEERFWKKLLKSKIQDQLKLMLWKLASNSLLVRGKMGFLRTNSEDVLNHCLIYNIETESVEHLFLQCKISQILWQHGTWPLNIEVYAQLNIEDWFHIILNPKQSLGLPDSQYQNFILFVALLLDGVWFLRNKVVHNEGNPEPTIRIHDLQRRCAEHTFTWVAHTATVSNSWQPPWVGCIKINVDVAVHQHFLIIAAICRNSLKHITKVWTKHLPNWTPFVGEIKAITFSIHPLS